MAHSIQCSCGTLQGSIKRTDSVNRCICYCADCQAFAHFLGRHGDILDDIGGTDIVQTQPKNVSFTAGTEKLACMKLTGNGLLRWYTTCCNTPIGNTPANFKMSFVGLIHNCLASTDQSLGSAFGPVRARVHTQAAKTDPKPKQIGLVSAVLRIMGMILKSRINGDYRQTPFFAADSGQPVAKPKVLNSQEFADIMSALQSR